MLIVLSFLPIRPADFLDAPCPHAQTLQLATRFWTGAATPLADERRFWNLPRVSLTA